MMLIETTLMECVHVICMHLFMSAEFLTSLLAFLLLVYVWFNLFKVFTREICAA